MSSYYVFFPSYYFFFVSTPTPDAAAAARMCAFTRVISHASTPMRWCPRIFLCVIHAHTHTHTHTHVYIYIYILYSAYPRACVGAKESFPARTCGGGSCGREGRGQWGEEGGGGRSVSWLLCKRAHSLSLRLVVAALPGGAGEDAATWYSSDSPRELPA